jgi:hypothetical protein
MIANEIFLCHFVGKTCQLKERKRRVDLILYSKTKIHNIVVLFHYQKIGISKDSASTTAIPCCPIVTIEITGRSNCTGEKK